MDNRFMIMAAYGIGGVIVFFFDLVDRLESGGMAENNVLPAFGNAIIWPWYLIQQVI